MRFLSIWLLVNLIRKLKLGINVFPGFKWPPFFFF